MRRRSIGPTRYATSTRGTRHSASSRARSSTSRLRSGCAYGDAGRAARMKVELSSLEARLIGCRIEQPTTTPAQYPLSLNALDLPRHQKSNRYPDLDLDDTT